LAGACDEHDADPNAASALCSPFGVMIEKKSIVKTKTPRLESHPPTNQGGYENFPPF